MLTLPICRVSLETKDLKCFVSFSLFTIFIHLCCVSVSDPELIKNNYQVDYDYFVKKVKDYVKIYNYTLDQRSLINAISFMYSPWSDPNNITLIRQGVIDVRV